MKLALCLCLSLIHCLNAYRIVTLPKPDEEVSLKVYFSTKVVSRTHTVTSTVTQTAFATCYSAEPNIVDCQNKRDNEDTEPKVELNGEPTSWESIITPSKTARESRQLEVEEVVEIVEPSDNAQVIQPDIGEPASVVYPTIVHQSREDEFIPDEQNLEVPESEPIEDEEDVEGRTSKPVPKFKHVEEDEHEENELEKDEHDEDEDEDEDDEDEHEEDEHDEDENKEDEHEEDDVHPEGEPEDDEHNGNSDSEFEDENKDDEPVPESYLVEEPEPETYTDLPEPEVYTNEPESFTFEPKTYNEETEDTTMVEEIKMEDFEDANPARDNPDGPEIELESSWEEKEVVIKQSVDTKCMEMKNNNLFMNVMSTLITTITQYETATVNGLNSVLFKSEGGCLPSDVDVMFSSSCV